MENVRIAFRDLIKCLDKDKQDHVITGFEDELDNLGVGKYDLIPTSSNLQSYKDRVKAYIRKHKDHLVIQIIKRG